MGKGFWTGREVRQGCPLSPSLFNMLVADLEEKLKRNEWGGRVKVKKKEKIYSLAYVDKVVLLAEEEEAMKCMIKGLERYLREKGLELNVKKYKLMKFRKGRKKEADRMVVERWRK